MDLPDLNDVGPDRPLYIAHRGAAALYPENTLAAYRAAHASGLRVLEQDVCALADGALGVMHDDTVDRTTDGHGAPSTFDSAAWAKLRIDVRRHPAFAESIAGRIAPPLFADVLAEFKGRAVFVPEAKSRGSGAALVAALQAAGIANGHALVQAFVLEDLEAAIAAGYPAMYLTSNARDIARARALGVTWAGIDRKAPGKVFDAWREAGCRLVAWTVNDRAERDRLLARGVSGFFSDDPLSLTRAA